MSNGDEKVCGTVRDALTAHKMDFQEADIQHATKFTVKSGAQSASINVYNSGDYSGPAPLRCKARLCAGMCNCRAGTRLGAGPPMRRYCTKHAMAGRFAASCRHRRRHSRRAATALKCLLAKRGVEASHRTPIGLALPKSSGNDGDIAAIYGFRSHPVKSAKQVCTSPATRNAPTFRFRGKRNLTGPLRGGGWAR
ncbi:hypothetical protein FB005_103123 [Sinorhizobium medicae]|nr:hypothetical protein FB006_102328 [Sinorhizobium medicae]TWA46978.1 hypothetical protein FB005_103123 [Sinorhizobium medicae]